MSILSMSMLSTFVDFYLIAFDPKKIILPTDSWHRDHILSTPPKSKEHIPLSKAYSKYVWNHYISQKFSSHMAYGW